MNHNVLCCFILSATISAADLSDINLGQYVYGQRVTSDQLKGKVVIFEYWGINCPPCRANIPHISELAALADTDQLVVIANQCQESQKTESVWTKSGGTERPCIVDHGQLKGASVQAIPRVFVFDHTGKQVFDGSPVEVDKPMIQKLLDAAPGPLVPSGDYVACRAEALALKQTDQPIAGILKTLRVKAAKGKPDTQLEAQRLLDGVNGYVQRLMSQVISNRSSNPVEAWQIAQRLQVLLKGDELGKPVEALIKELRSDKGFVNEMKAADILSGVKAAIQKMRVGTGSASSRKDDKQAIISALDQISSKYGGTVASVEANDLRRKLIGEM